MINAFEAEYPYSVDQYMMKYIQKNLKKEQIKEKEEIKEKKFLKNSKLQ